MIRDNNDLKRDQYISNKQKRYINWFIPLQKFSQQKLTFVPQQITDGLQVRQSKKQQNWGEAVKWTVHVTV